MRKPGKMVIEKEEDANRRGKRTKGNRNVVKGVQLFCALNCNHLKSSEGRPSQPEKEGIACRGERAVVGILKIKSL